MFTIPRQNVIESDEGFSVEVLGRTGLLYTEGAKCLNVDSEVLAGPDGLVVYKDSITTWKAPHNDEIIHETTRDAIVEKIPRAFHYRGYEIEVC